MSTETKRGAWGTWVKVADGREVYVPDEPEKTGKRTLRGGYELSKASKRSLYLQTGRRFESYSQYQKWCKAEGFRDIEKGERKDEQFKILQEWGKAGAPGETPKELRHVRPVRPKESYEAWCHRVGRRVGYLQSH